VAGCSFSPGVCAHAVVNLLKPPPAAEATSEVCVCDWCVQVARNSLVESEVKNHMQLRHPHIVALHEVGAPGQLPPAPFRYMTEGPALQGAVHAQLLGCRRNATKALHGRLAKEWGTC
jgi:hypothetical protein